MSSSTTEPELQTQIGIAGNTKSDFGRLLAPYRRPDWRKSLGQVVVSVVLFLGCWTAAYQCLQLSYWLTLLWALPTAGLTVRIFCIMHDCSHGSFFRSRRVADAVGSLLGLFCCTPYGHWRRLHATHHATSGNLERRGEGGDIRVMTVREYQQARPLVRWIYRLYRNPIVLFGIGPTVFFLIEQRFTFGVPADWKSQRAAIHGTNLSLLVIIMALCWWLGAAAFVAVQLPITMIATSAGVWLFYVQHNYQYAYWKHDSDWSFVDAALLGSSYCRLPRILEWTTASIGLHHIHHLDSKIPNYHLRTCLEENVEFQRAPEMTLLQTLACAQLKLWDEDGQRMVRFAAANRPATSPRCDV